MYPLDRRRVAKNIYDQLLSLRKVAILLNTSHSTISRWLKNPEQKPYSNRCTTKSSIVIESIRLAVHLDPFISIRELTTKIQIIHKIEVSRELIRIAIGKLGLTKKKARYHGSPPHLEKATSDFIFMRDFAINNNYQILSIDETSFGRNGLITRGYAKRGDKLFVKNKKPTVQTTTVLACASSEGWKKLLKFKGSGTSQRFLDFLKSLNLSKNTYILMDNARIHHTSEVKEFIDSKDCKVLYTPPYSPWFNPIELCFSIVKRYFCRHQEIDASFEYLTPDHFKAFFSKSLSATQAF